MSAWPRGMLAGLLAAAAAVAGPTDPPVATPLGDYHAALSAPTRVAAAASGLLYVAEPAADQVLVFDAFGRVRETRSGFATPLALAMDPAGRLLVGEGGAGRVARFDAAGALLDTLGSGDGEFAAPAFVAVDPTPGRDRVFVSDGPAQRIAVYTNGALAFRFGTAGTGAGQFQFPAGLAATSNELYVVDQGADRVQVFDHAGGFLRQFTLVITNSAGQLGGRAHGLGLDGAGRVYVADAFQGLVKVFSPTGGLLAVLGALGDGPGQLRSPCDVALDAFGRLFIASPNHARVDLFGLDAYLHFTASPGDGTLAAGSQLTLSVVAAGAGPFAFQWHRGTNDLAGATNATLTLSGLTLADAGDYAVTVTGPTGTWSSGAAVLAVLTAPSLIAPPAAQTVAQGSNVEFSVAAAGDALTYQWIFNGAPLAGATNATLAIPGAQPGDGGAYAVRVANAVGEVIGGPAALTVIAPPAILLDPADQKVVQGDVALFGVAAAGDQLTYTWRHNGGPLPAPDEPTLAVGPAQLPAAGLYAVVVSNPVGVVTSATAQLSVFVPPAVAEVGAVEPQPGAGLRVQLAGDAGYTFALDASADLQDWLRVTNLTSETGLFEYLDPEADTATNRFYRLRWRP